jgi:hypothetical protein
MDSARTAQVPLSKYCLEMIRRGMEPREPIIIEDNAPLHHEIRQQLIRIRELEREVFELQGRSLQSHRECSFSPELICLMQDGRVRRPAEILRELGLTASIETLSALSAHLHRLQDLHVVEERQNGWKWI